MQKFHPCDENCVSIVLFDNAGTFLECSFFSRRRNGIISRSKELNRGECVDVKM